MIVIYVGGNDADPFANYPDGMCAPQATLDACLTAYAPSLAANLDGIVTAIEGLRGGKPTAIRVSSDYNPFIGWHEAPSPRLRRHVLCQVAAAETAAACQVAERHHARCIDVFEPLQRTKRDRRCRRVPRRRSRPPRARGHRRHRRCTGRRWPQRPGLGNA